MFPLNATEFMQIYSANRLHTYLLIGVINAIILFLASFKFILVLQQCGYRGKRYFKWLGNKETPYLSRLKLLSLLAFLFFAVLNMCFMPVMKSIGIVNGGSYIGFASYILFTIVYIKTESSVNAKVPIKKTRRLVRLCITYFIVLFAMTYGLLVLLDYLAFTINDEVVAILRYSLICGMPILIPYVFFGAYCLNEPFEHIIRTHYIRSAEHKLDQADIIKIGVTGSYGKTSVKEILKTILSQKYRVLATPSSYNTPLGIALTVKNLDSTHDVFIAEMGARAKGDIKDLVKIVKPQFGVLTGVNNQHLETFGDIETTMATKYELFESLEKDGVGFFSSDNERAQELMKKFGGEKYSAGVNGANNLVTASDIVTDVKGMSFMLNIQGEESVRCSTTLLGKHSVRNICLAAAVAYMVGLTPEEIAVGINRIQSIGHRLELMPNNKNIVIIDDSYNASIDGVKAAMDVLDTFTGRKIVLTPGLVELGKIENLANFEMGKMIAEHADKVIVIGKHNAVMLINGLIEGGMDRANIKFAKNLNKGNELLNSIMQEGDVVLFENDLPDNYN